MENSFSNRIEAEIRRSKVVSADDEERTELERWLVSGAPCVDAPADRYSAQRGLQ